MEPYVIYKRALQHSLKSPMSFTKELYNIHQRALSHSQKSLILLTKEPSQIHKRALLDLQEGPISFKKEPCYILTKEPYYIILTKEPYWVHERDLRHSHKCSILACYIIYKRALLYSQKSPIRSMKEPYDTHISASFLCDMTHTYE